MHRFLRTNYVKNANLIRCFSTLPPFAVPRQTLVKNALKLGIEYLRSLRSLQPGSKEVHATESFASKVVLSHVLGIGGRLALSTKEENAILDERQVDSYSQLIERVGKGEPLQYVIGEWSFGDIDLKLSPDVLIPRSDSEVIIEAIESTYTDTNRKLTFVDIGVGSGCLLLSALKKYPNAVGIGIDISPGALKITHHNASQLGLLDRTSLFCIPMQSLLQLLQQNDTFAMHALIETLRAIAHADVLISNPPYIKTSDVAKLQPEVRDYEPAIALDGGVDGLKFYRILASIFSIIIGNNPQAKAFFEIGFGQRDDVAEILAGNEGVVVLNVQKDRAGIDRCIVSCKKPTI